MFVMFIYVNGFVLFCFLLLVFFLLLLFFFFVVFFLFFVVVFFLLLLFLLLLLFCKRYSIVASLVKVIMFYNISISYIKPCLCLVIKDFYVISTGTNKQFLNNHHIVVFHSVPFVPDIIVGLYFKEQNRTEHKLYYHSSLTKTYEDMAKYNKNTWHDKLQTSIQIHI